MQRHHITDKDAKQHQAFILAIDSAYYREAVCTKEGTGEMVHLFSHPINHVPHQIFLASAQSYLTIREREYLDNSMSYGIYTKDGAEMATDFITNAKGDKKKGDPRYKQLLPYLIARQLQDDGTYLYFPYRRTKKVGESRLAGNGSLGYGGHIDLNDVLSTNSVIDLKATILKSALREAIEEFTLYDNLNNEAWQQREYENRITFGDLFIVDNSNDVGELHLGIIMYFDVPQGWTLEASEDELAKLPPMTVEEMLSSEDFNPENWTAIYIRHVLSKEVELKKSEDVEFEESISAIERMEDDERAVQETVSIDHGGKQVGLVDESYFAKAVAEYNPSDYNQSHDAATQQEPTLSQEAKEYAGFIGERDAAAFPTTEELTIQASSPLDATAQENLQGIVSVIKDHVPTALQEKQENTWEGNGIDWNKAITGDPNIGVNLNLNAIDAAYISNKSDSNQE